MKHPFFKKSKPAPAPEAPAAPRAPFPIAAPEPAETVPALHLDARVLAFLRKYDAAPDQLDTQELTDALLAAMPRGLRGEAGGLPMLPAYLAPHGHVAAPEGKRGAVIDAGMKRVGVMGFAYCISAFMDCTIAASRGLGKTVGPTVSVILGACGLRGAGVYTSFAHFHTIPALYLLYPCSWALPAAAEIVYFVFSYRHAALCLQERDALAQL